MPVSLPSKYNLLALHPNDVYLDIGIWRGDSIQFAIDAGCFKKIIGIDINPESIDFCKSRFDFNNPDGFRNWITLVEGDSALCLWDVIKDIDTPITFFLDSHYSLLEDEVKGPNPFPLLDELDQINQHPIKEHTIIIDDFLYMTHPQITGWTIDTIEDKLMEINMYYSFNYIANPIIGNILIAKP